MYVLFTRLIIVPNNHRSPPLSVILYCQIWVIIFYDRLSKLLYHFFHIYLTCNFFWNFSLYCSSSSKILATTSESCNISESVRKIDCFPFIDFLWRSPKSKISIKIVEKYKDLNNAAIVWCAVRQAGCVTNGLVSRVRHNCCSPSPLPSVLRAGLVSQHSVLPLPDTIHTTGVDCFIDTFTCNEAVDFLSIYFQINLFQMLKKGSYVTMCTILRIPL